MFKCTVALHVILIFNENIMKLSERSKVVAEVTQYFNILLAGVKYWIKS